ncbi:hypothetical protein K1719_035621 [Acacia pycnantha]|nr:hypothetical protein K1719_035621 [Acacia pycnantha]
MPKGELKRGQKRVRTSQGKNIAGEETIVVPTPNPSTAKEASIPTLVPTSPVREAPTSTPVPASPVRGAPSSTPAPVSPATSVPSSFSTPHSHTTMNGGVLWSDGVNEAIRNLMRPPAQLYSPTMPSKEEKLQLINMEREAYRVASLIRPYAALRIQNVVRLKSVNDLNKQVVTLTKDSETERKDKNKLLSEILEEVAEAETKLSAMQSDLNAARLDFFAKQSELADAQAKMHRLEGLCRENASLKEKLISDIDHLIGVLKEKDADLAHVKSQIVKYGQIGKLSFENAVAQIRVLNPTVTLNTTGLHLEAYVSNKGKLIPPGEEDSEDESASPSAAETHSQI